MDEVSSEDGEAGGVSSADGMEAGVVGREDNALLNVKIGELVVGGVGGLIGRMVGVEGNGDIDNTVAIFEKRYRRTS